MVKMIEALVPGGKATPGPPLGPALGPLGINVKAVIDKINDSTKDFDGMQVPVKVIVEDNKSFRIEVGTPPASALILKEIKAEKGAGTPNTQTVGNLTIDQVVRIARMKKTGTLAKSLKACANEIIGTCTTMGVTVEGMKPKDAIAAVKSGKFDSVLSGTL
ncbi:MAG TPA: 50S ribosomal protein L11 [Candidatus Methanoperedenaceae archaeon]|nr:50S ribosomal protein L11 [Candidatus Methanoperedenaceae archaeon]